MAPSWASRAKIALGACLLRLGRVVLPLRRGSIEAGELAHGVLHSKGSGSAIAGLN